MVLPGRLGRGLPRTHADARSFRVRPEQPRIAYAQVPAVRDGPLVRLLVTLRPRDGQERAALEPGRQLAQPGHHRCLVRPADRRHPPRPGVVEQPGPGPQSPVSAWVISHSSLSSSCLSCGSPVYGGSLSPRAASYRSRGSTPDRTDRTVSVTVARAALPSAPDWP